jgi:LysM repeat protein
MAWKTRIVLAIVTALLLAAFAAPSAAHAWYGCGSTYVVQWGDTLSGIAVKCGTTVSAIQQANPGLGTYIYAGQTLYMPGYGYNTGYVPPTSYYGTYVVQPGDTMRKIAAKTGTCLADLIAVNPQIPNPNVIYSGQVIYLPAPNSYCTTYTYSYNYNYNYYYPSGSYTVQWGDKLNRIASSHGTTVDYLMTINPQIWNPNVIYAGQVIRVQ